MGDIESDIERVDSILNSMTGRGVAGTDQGASVYVQSVKRLSLEELRALTYGSGLARRICELIPARTSAAGWGVQVTRGDAVDMDVAADIDRELDIPAKIAEVGAAANRDGGAYLVLRSSEEAADLSTEYTAGARVVAIEVLLCDELQPSGDMYSASRSDYSDPEVFDVSGPVHSSRVIYFGGVQVDRRRRSQSSYRVDDSALQSCWTTMSQMMGIRQSGPGLVERISMTYLQLGESGKHSHVAKGNNTFKKRMVQFARSLSSIGLGILRGDETLQTIGSNVAGYGEIADRARVALAADVGWPQVVLYGDTPGGLNSDGASQAQLMAGLVEQYQVKIDPQLRRLYGHLLTADRDGGRVLSDAGASWTIAYRPSYTPTEAEVAALRLSHAQADQIHILSEVLTPEHVARSRYTAQGYQGDILPVDEEELPDDILVGDPSDLRASDKPKMLNGAQIASALEIIGRAAQGTITDDMADIMLREFLGLDPAAARRIVSELSRVNPDKLLQETDDSRTDRDLTAPKAVREELRRALAWHKEGHTGPGTKPETVAWATRLEQGEPITRDKAVEMSAWHARHSRNKRAQGFRPGEKGYPSPGRVSHAFWGGDPAIPWSADVVTHFKNQDKE